MGLASWNGSWSRTLGLTFNCLTVSWIQEQICLECGAILWPKYSCNCGRSGLTTQIHQLQLLGLQCIYNTEYQLSNPRFSLQCACRSEIAEGNIIKIR